MVRITLGSEPSVDLAVYHSYGFGFFWELGTVLEADLIFTPEDPRAGKASMLSFFHNFQPGRKPIILTPTEGMYSLVC